MQPNTSQFEPHLKCITTLEPLGLCLTHKAATLAIVGTASDWDLRKHRNALTEYSDYAKVCGTDNLERIYYSLPGLIKLCDLIGTARARAFKDAIVQYATPAGALQVQPQAVPATVQTSYREPAPQTGFGAIGGQLAASPDQSQVLALLQRSVSTAVRQSLAEHQATQTMQQPQTRQTPIEDVLLEQQDREIQRLQAYTNSFLAVSGQTQGHELNMSDKRKPYVVSQAPDIGQDKIITLLLVSSLTVIIGTAFYFIGTLIRGGSQQPHSYQPSAQVQNYEVKA